LATELAPFPAQAIGKGGTFCKNPGAMREEWKNFWLRWAKHLWMLPIGLPISFVFFLIAMPKWRQGGMLLKGLMISAVYGVVIPITIALCFGAAYAARLQISLKTGRPFKVSTPINIVINAVGLALGLQLGMMITHAVFGALATGGHFLTSIVFGGGVMVVFSFYLAYKQAKEEALALRAEVAEARYHALENRMRPHFLFNALNSLAELIESRRENAAETTYKLSDLYRRILDNSGLKTAPLDSEIEIVRLYLELEQLRFGQRLNFSVEQPENSHELFLPSLTMQTLVENAVKHGVAPSIEGGHIAIEIARRPDNLYALRVTNTGTRYHPQVSNNGTGMANTRARLELLYGARHEFKIESDRQGRTVASFCFTGENID
jgi:Histidine kinase